VNIVLDAAKTRTHELKTAASKYSLLISSANQTICNSSFFIIFAQAQGQLYYTLSLLSLEMHKWSATPISGCFRRRPRGHFCNEYCLGGCRRRQGMAKATMTSPNF